jgi:hypothetical protein
MKIRTILTSCLLLFFVGCSDNETIEPTAEPNPDLKLKIDRTTITPFDKATVSIDVDLELLYNSYDSVMWKYNGTWWNGIITIPNDDDERDLHITDYRLGKNKVYAIGYKDGAITSQAEIEYEVVEPTKNFFLINWKDQNIKELNTNRYTSWMRLVKSEDTSLEWHGIQLCLWHFPKKDTPEYAILDFIPRSVSIHGLNQQMKANAKTKSTLPDIDNYDFINKMDDDDAEVRKEAREMTRSFFHEYITMIYGESILKYDGEDVRQTTLWNDYNSRFKNPLDSKIYPHGNNNYPIEIWETPSTYICLFSLYTGWYYVIAEPRN